ncbi:transglutaminase-like domain-containing protein [Paracoccus sp. (in: a-proteobacteria)]|uniref:transglutaminase-like domain-containing protein n=1 Tax=Paracoccus sp. TaxID=267 RepID=UPI00396CD668
MRMKIDVALDYRLEAPGPALLVIEAAGVTGQTIHEASIDLGQPAHLARVPGEEGIGERIVMRANDRMTCHYSAEVEVTRPRPDLSRLQPVEVEHMPGDALRYLLPSRYCPTERFAHFVGSRFGDTRGGARVVALRDWVERNLDYVSGSSDGNTTAADTFLDRRGVCRDYAHLLITLCRASQIPARIASVYAPSVEPQDFHAVAEVYLSGEWHLVDATGMATADSMAMVAVGRDATDVAFLTTITGANLQTQTVSVRQLV